MIFLQSGCDERAFGGTAESSGRDLLCAQGRLCSWSHCLRGVSSHILFSRRDDTRSEKLPRLRSLDVQADIPDWMATLVGAKRPDAEVFWSVYHRDGLKTI